MGHEQPGRRFWQRLNQLGQLEYGGTWLSTHLWEHFAFTQNKTFLQSEAYPLMRGAAQFCLEWLVPDKEGNLITSPSTSPENVFITNKGYKGMYAFTAAQPTWP